MKKWLFIPVAVGALAFVVASAGEKSADTVTVQTAILETRTVEQTVSCSGVVEAREGEGVFPTITCVVDEVLVEEGQRVEAGDTLLTIDKEATKLVQQSDDRITGALSLLTMADVVTAPTDGIILSVETAAGELVNESIPCVVMAPYSALQVRVSIREKLLPSLEVGQKARISGAGFEKELYHGQLTEIASMASSSSSGEAMVEGIISLENGEADASMRLGLTAKVKVVTSITQDGLIVPHDAVCRDGDEGRYIYVVEDGAAVRRSITVSAELVDGVLLSSNEYAGCAVILEPEKVSADGISVLQEEVR